MNGNESLTTTEIKKQNCKKVFDYLYQNQRTSKQTIAQALGLSMPTVSQNLKLLEGAGVVRRDGFYESTGGRKAHVLRFVQDARVAVGVAILEGSVQLCAVDLLGEVLREETHPLPYENSDGYYQQVGRLVRGLMAHLPYGKERVLGVGIAIQGLVSADGERVVYGAILNNNGVTREMFQRYIPYPCRLLHDTEVGAAAEFWHNQEIRDAIYLVLNRNMGGALVVDGKVQQGSGIIEHMTLFSRGRALLLRQKGLRGGLLLGQQPAPGHGLSRGAVLPAPAGGGRAVPPGVGRVSPEPGPGHGQHADAGGLQIRYRRLFAAVFDRGGHGAAHRVYPPADRLPRAAHLPDPKPLRPQRRRAGGGHLLYRPAAAKHRAAFGVKE
ncbi:MAG: ROK family transcriptional regulator [Lawsonibacter sp.]